MEVKSKTIKWQKEIPFCEGGGDVSSVPFGGGCLRKEEPPPSLSDDMWFHVLQVMAQPQSPSNFTQDSNPSLPQMTKNHIAAIPIPSWFSPER